MRHFNRIFQELTFRPSLFRELLVSLAGNTLFPHKMEEIGAISFSVKNHYKSRKIRIGLKLLLTWLPGNILEKSRYNLILQDIQ